MNIMRLSYLRKNKKAILLATAIFIGCGATAQEAGDESRITVTGQDGTEEVIDLPEAITQELDSLLAMYYSQQYLKPDEDCNYRDFNPEYDAEAYIGRLKRLPNIMEMPYNDVVRKFIDRYAGRMRRTVGYWLGAANFYMPIFEQALETYNMPLELKYLPVIESGLNPNAVSRVGATGLWQFMLATGKMYGLEVNSIVDERRDPIKASHAAARYLRDLYRIFGDWNLVIAAYNCGPENINRAIHRAGGERDYWKIYPYLPSETRGYVPAFIAANYIMNYYCEHNICPLKTKLPAKSDTVVVNKDLHLKQIAAVCGIDIDELRTLNPQYRRDIVNGFAGPKAIRLPDQTINTFIDNEEAIYLHDAENLLTKRSEVEVNEAKVAASKPAGRNGRGGKGGKGGKKHQARSGGKNVTVKSGQTLSEIARRNHTTVDKLRRLNGIKGNNIRAGKKLRVK